LSILQAEVIRTMALLGCASIHEIAERHVRDLLQ
jgi:isopentenyl diphosphate isomerase/L-lactate dehydrogenase-like FMN-dependent dehydrogenase